MEKLGVVGNVPRCGQLGEGKRSIRRRDLGVGKGVGRVVYYIVKMIIPNGGFSFLDNYGGTKPLVMISFHFPSGRKSGPACVTSLKDHNMTFRLGHY